MLHHLLSLAQVMDRQGRESQEALQEALDLDHRAALHLRLDSADDAIAQFSEQFNKEKEATCGSEDQVVDEFKPRDGETHKEEMRSRHRAEAAARAQTRGRAAAAERSGSQAWAKDAAGRQDAKAQTSDKARAALEAHVAGGGCVSPLPDDLDKCP